MDRLDAMAVLLGVVEAGSLSAGARRLNAPLATVSRKVSDLEAHLRTRLLIRTTRKLELTEAGRAYVGAARDILEQVGEAERAAAGEYQAPRGELVVTAPTAFGRLHLMPIAADFLAEHPAITLTMIVNDRNQNLVEDHVHVAVRVGALTDPMLMATRVGMVRRTTCASPAYIARRGIPASPEELGEHDAVAVAGIAERLVWEFRRDGQPVLATIRARITVNLTETALDAALAGIGIARLMSYQVADALAEGTLVPLLEEFASEPLAVSLIYPSQGLLPLKVRAFLNWCAPRLRARLAED